MTAFTFSLTSLDTGAAVGYGLICVDARYASVRWLGAERLDRRHVSPARWNAIASEMRLGLPPAPLAAASEVSALFLPAERRQGTVVRYLAGWPVDEDTNVVITVQALDSLLWATK